VAKTTIGSIQRSLLVLEQQGAANFFGEPVLRISDLMRKDRAGQGYISVLAADKLMDSPRLYATFLLFLLSELFEELPEVGDPDKPKLVFFFDEAHLLFSDAPKALLEKVEQVVRLIRSKGVGVYFVTQNPLDIPDTVSRQLGNRVQHALRAFTPAEQKAVRSAAQTFRKNPKIDTEQAIMELGIGEALVSTLDEKGQPTMVQKTLIKPPNSQVGPITEEERAAVLRESPVAGEYDEAAERKSAYEILKQRTAQRADAEAADNAETEDAAAAKKKASSGGSRSDGFWTTLGKSLVRTLVPAATRMLERELRRRTGGGGGFTGLGALDTKGGKSSAKSNAGASSAGEAGYVPFKSIPDEPGWDARGLMGTPKRR
jgi:DNA helicase HerA-like ATPase